MNVVRGNSPIFTISFPHKSAANPAGIPEFILLV